MHALNAMLDKLITKPGPHLSIKTVFPIYEDSHVKDKRPSYL